MIGKRVRLYCHLTCIVNKTNSCVQIEWADKPQTAEKIRLIYFGRMLEDSSTLKDCKLDGTAGPNVVHMSIRPPDTIEEDADPKHASRAAEDEGSRGCCGGCMIM